MTVDGSKDDEVERSRRDRNDVSAEAQRGVASLTRKGLSCAMLCSRTRSERARKVERVSRVAGGVLAVSRSDFTLNGGWSFRLLSACALAAASRSALERNVVRGRGVSQEGMWWRFSAWLGANTSGVEHDPEPLRDGGVGGTLRRVGVGDGDGDARRGRVGGAVHSAYSGNRAASSGTWALGSVMRMRVADRIALVASRTMWSIR